MPMTEVTVPLQFFVDIESTEAFWNGWNAGHYGTTTDYGGDDPRGRSATIGYALACKLKRAMQDSLVGLGQKDSAEMAPFVRWENPDAAALRDKHMPRACSECGKYPCECDDC